MACMRMIWTAVLSAAIAMSLPALASGQTDVRALQNALHGKQLGLRSYSADPVAQYKWVDGGLATGTIVLHGLEGFLDDSVKLKDGKIVFRGNRATLVRDGTKLYAVARSSMTLEVDLQGADPAGVIPQLQTALFFSDVDSAIAGLPNLVEHMLPAQIEKNQQKESPTCDCYKIYKDGNWIEIAKSVSKYTNPVILATADPTYSKDASDAKISGTVSLVIHVSEKGRVDEVWLLRPLGFGLDENAANAVRQYVFRPAQLDGKPVEAELTVGVNFQIY